MAVYTTFLAATSTELGAAFPGWFKPLPEPVKRTTVIRSTKQSITYDSWEPEEALRQPVPARWPAVVAMQGDYQTYLSSRLPEGVQALPNIAAKGVLSPHVEQLLAVVAKHAEERLLPALFPPGGSAATGKTLDVLPSWGVEVLSGLADEALPQLGELLVKTEGWFAEEGWAAQDCTRLLGELRGVARKARDGKRAMYLFSEA